MSNPIKEQFSADFQKAKQAGGTRVERIRKIFQDALAQTAAELKEGTSEIQSIAKESTSAWAGNPKEKQEVNQTAPIPVEVRIETDEEHLNNSVNPTVMDVDTKPVIAETVVQPEAEVQPLNIHPADVNSTDAHSTDAHSTEAVTDEAITDEAIIEAIAQPLIEFAEANEQMQGLRREPAKYTTENASEDETVPSLLDSIKELMEQAMRSVKQGETHAALQQQFGKLREQLLLLDTKLSARYGNRYEAIKQDFKQDLEKAKVWYQETKSDAAASGTNWTEQKQSEVEAKMSEAGATIAQKEQKIKHLLKELWHTVRS